MLSAPYTLREVVAKGKSAPVGIGSLGIGKATRAAKQAMTSFALAD
eukprot:COSAG02_NODE_743_length_17764_cov_9.908916_4_plen_46_part_00